MKNTIEIEGIIQKKNLSEITEKEYDKIIDDLLDTISKHNCIMATSFKLCSEEEL